MNWTEKLENKALYSKWSRMRLMLPSKKLQCLCRCCIQSHKSHFFHLHNCLCFVFFSRSTNPNAFARIWLRECFSPEACINLQQDRGLYHLKHIWTVEVGKNQYKLNTWVVLLEFTMKFFLELHTSKLIHFIMFVTVRSFKQNTGK